MKHRHRAFIVFGWRSIATRDGSPPVTGQCPACKTPSAKIVGKIHRRWFTLYFIPIFPVQLAKNAPRISQCCSCKQMFNCPPEHLSDGQSGARSSITLADTIGVYNQLRERPADGQLLLKLLAMYQILDEVGEAETAARHFPRAMAAEPACGQILEQMREDAKARTN